MFVDPNEVRKMKEGIDEAPKPTPATYSTE